MDNCPFCQKSWYNQGDVNVARSNETQVMIPCEHPGHIQHKETQ